MIRPKHKTVYYVRIGCWWICSKWFYDRFPGYKSKKRVPV